MGHVTKAGGRTTSHFGDGVSFHGARTRTDPHTHCCIWLGGAGWSGYFGGKVIGAEVRDPPSHPRSRRRRTGLLRSRRSDRLHVARAARTRGVSFAHLKCAPLRRALSATDSVCSLLQDGGSAPIHFLLIASQLSLSARSETRRSPA